MPAKKHALWVELSWQVDYHAFAMRRWPGVACMGYLVGGCMHVDVSLQWSVFIEQVYITQS